MIKLRVFFTADCHFDHEAIIKYCHRPFKNIDHMNEELVRRWNAKVREDDLVYHIGDFTFKHPHNAQYWEEQLNGKIVHILGNHDKNNKVKSLITHAIMEFGGMVFYVTHTPPDTEQKGTIQSELIKIADVILTAHVHDLWKYKITKDNKIMLNVGVDVWNFEPIKISTILKMIRDIKKGRNI